MAETELLAAKGFMGVNLFHVYFPCGDPEFFI